MTIAIIPVFALFGLGSGIAGLLILYRAWLQKERSTALLSAGWAALLGSFIFWIYAGGVDRGVALGLIANCLAALCFVGYSAAKQPAIKTKPAQKRNPVQQNKQGVSSAQLVKSIGGILFLGPVCGILAFTIAMGIYESLDIVGTEKANSLVTGLFAFPIIWSAIVSFSLISKRKLLKKIIFLFAPLLSVALIFARNA